MPNFDQVLFQIGRKGFCSWTRYGLRKPIFKTSPMLAPDIAVILWPGWKDVDAGANEASDCRGKVGLYLRAGDGIKNILLQSGKITRTPESIALHHGDNGGVPHLVTDRRLEEKREVGAGGNVVEVVHNDGQLGGDFRLRPGQSPRFVIPVESLGDQAEHACFVEAVDRCFGRPDQCKEICRGKWRPRLVPEKREHVSIQ